ncbi:hypothetical protein CK203_084059 [Vitis vinifera]|uniref:Uncharacterized protein n=1 Tax=Vitis vinifera TaxID=29760 RepID=A0A438FK25_VITVI|nr:hypothetical protein CK203_084059 [Vitis vinifera]
MYSSFPFRTLLCRSSIWHLTDTWSGSRKGQCTPRKPHSSCQNITSKGTAETGSAVSFSDDEDLSQLSGSKSTTKGRSSSSATFKYSHDASEHGKDSYRCILHREVLVQPLIEMLHYADVQLREMSSFALGRLA